MTNSLSANQNHFSAALRQQEQAQHPDIERYQRLVMHNIGELLQRCFPVLFSILPDAISQRLLADFFKHGKTSSPLFHQLPALFVTYLQSSAHPDYPFIAELAHYEWIELVVELALDEPSTPIAEMDILAHPLRLASTARLLHYTYDVENICANYLPQHQQASYLLVYRTTNYQVQFLALNASSYTLLHELFTSGKNARTLLNNKQLEQHGQAFLSALLNEGILVLCCKQGQNKHLSPK